MTQNRASTNPHIPIRVAILETIKSKHQSKYIKSIVHKYRKPIPPPKKNQHQRRLIQHRKISTESPQRFPTVRLKMWRGGGEILQHNKQWIRHTTHTRRERRGCGGDLIW